MPGRSIEFEVLLDDLRTALEDLYGDRLVLYGSQDASPDEGRFIPAPSRTLRRSNAAFNFAVRTQHSNGLGALGNVNGGFRSLVSEPA